MPPFPSVDFYQAVTDNMDEGLCATDAQGLITFMNKAAEILLGWTFQELKGRRMHDVAHHHLPDGLPFPIEQCVGFQVLRTGRALRDYDDEFVRKDGRVLPVSYSSSPLRSDGKIVGLVVVFRDASERRVIEHTLRANEADARLLQQLGAEMVREGDSASFYQKVVDGASQIMESEFASMQKFHPENGKLELLAFRGFMAEDSRRWQWIGTDSGTTCAEALRTGTRVVAADTENSKYTEIYHGTAIRAVQSTPLYSRSGTLVGMLSTHWDHPHEPSPRDFRNLDILARQAADIIDQQHTLQEANRRKDHFLATLAHELRNPLAPIRNALTVLNATGITSERAEHARQVIGRQLNQMVRLIDDLMDVNRITRGTLELRRRRFEITPLVLQAVESCFPADVRRTREVHVQLPSQPVFVDADPVRLHQILCNVLSNAHKFSDDHDRISIEAGSQGRDLILTVSDSGIGIAPGKLETIFEMFSQIEQAPERGMTGLGIGLALVKQLTKLHGGSVTVQSDGVGKGSRFVIRLPVITNPPLDPPPATARSQSQLQDSRRVLVVDDNRDNADSLAALLQVDGYDVRLAYDGEEALAVAELYRPHVLLLDIGLPKLSGYDVCRRLRSTPWARQATIVAVTGWGQERDRAQARASGFDAHLVKPVDYAKLAEVLAAPRPPEAAPLT